MDKMKMESVDIRQKNIDKIAEMFPGAITEKLDEKESTVDKKVYKKAVNFDLLRQLLSEEEVAGDEAYEFTWVGKKRAIIEANRYIRKTLRPCKEESLNWENTKNIFIEGDNLDVLKLLQESYLSAVKMIYIDPPYNTGKDFVYPDSFIMNNEDYDEGTGYFDENGNVNYSRENSTSAGRYHSDWCSMIYARLLLARNLLSDDGVIFISIDGNEIANLKKICSEVFGESNELALISWKRKKEISNDSNNVAIQGEYILVYAKSNAAKLSYEPISQEYLDKSYNEPTDQFPLGKWRPVPLTVSKGLSGGGYTYTVTTPSGAKHTRLWAYPEKSFAKLVDENRVYYGKNNDGIPQRVMYASDSKGQPVSNYWDNIATNKEGKKEILDLFGDNFFDTPKPIKLILRMLKISTEPEDIILDFFAGSSTTAHAIMQMNAEEGGNRKFIMVQVPEPCAENSIARDTGYSTIAEISKQRIIYAAKKIQENNPSAIFDGGFRVFKLDNSSMKDVYYAPGDYNQNILDMIESNIKEDRTDLDLLFSCILEWGMPLSLPYIEEVIDGVKIHNVADGDLIACFEENINEDVIKKIASREQKPLRVVFRDSSFANSPAKINVEEIFKLLSPNTKIKVL